MSLKQDRTGTRTSEDLRRRLNLRDLDEAVKETDENSKIVKEMSSRVEGMSESLDNTRRNYVSTQPQTFTEEQKINARKNIGAGNSSFSGSYNDLANKPTSLSNINLEEGKKLAGIENGAQKNKIEKIKLNGVEQSVNSGEIDLIISSNDKPLTTNDIYPVGSIYMSVNSVNPTKLFGGTWEQIKDTFLLACGKTYSNGATGGSTTTDAHALKINEMPEHGHNIKATYGEKQWTLGYLWARGAGPNDGNTIGGQTDSINTGKTGEGKGHTHTFMPPYLAVYVWKRTA